MSQNSPDNGSISPVTRSSQRRNDQYLRPSNRSIPELISDPLITSNVTNEATARTELTSRGMLVPASGASIEALTEALLEFTLQAPGLTRLHTDLIRAIAILLSRADHELKARCIAEATTRYLADIMKRLEKIADQHEATHTKDGGAPHLSSDPSPPLPPTIETHQIAEVIINQLIEPLTSHLVDHITTTLAPQVSIISTASESLASTLSQATQLHNVLERERQEKEDGIAIATERLEEAAYALYSNVEDCENTIKLLSPSLESTQNRLNTLSEQLTAQNNITATRQTLPPSHSVANDNTPPPTIQQTRSYSSIAAVHLPPSVDQAVARASIRARQILLEPNPGNSPFPLNSSNLDIANKIKEALLKIHIDTTPAGEVRAVQVQRNGSLVIELDNENLANWLRSATGRAALEKQLDLTVTLRDRTHPVVIQFLPVTWDIYREDFLRRVEKENSLSVNSLVSIRWIKPPHRRTTEQSKAFALLQVSDALTANNILREGIYIDKARFSVNKDKKEPIRCAKCQNYGHMARNCSAQADTCGTCGAHHRTSECVAYRTTYCVSCRSQNHASWSRSCPELAKRSAALDEKLPENKMPYFPTPSSWTQTIHPPKPPPQTRPRPQLMPNAPQPPKNLQRHPSRIVSPPPGQRTQASTVTNAIANANRPLTQSTLSYRPPRRRLVPDSDLEPDAPALPPPAQPTQPPSESLPNQTQPSPLPTQTPTRRLWSEEPTTPTHEGSPPSPPYV